MPPTIETLAPSDEIDGYGTSRLVSDFALFHPRGRERTFDYYLGGSFKYYLLDINDETGDTYDLKIDTPSAFDLAAKIRTYWFLNDHWGLTCDIEAGSVFYEYTVKDRISSLSEDVDSPYTMIHFGLGLSYRF